MADSLARALAPPEGSDAPVDWWTKAQARPVEVVRLADDGDTMAEVSRTGGDAATLTVSASDYIVEPRRISAASTPLSGFRLLQAWEGRVVEVYDGCFLARLVDLTTPGVEEEIEIDLDDITPDDVPLVAPGAIFYWNIGYLVAPSGSKSRESDIRFRRLPRWSERDVRRIQARVEQMKEHQQTGG